MLIFRFAVQLSFNSTSFTLQLCVFYIICSAVLSNQLTIHYHFIKLFERNMRVQCVCVWNNAIFVDTADVDLVDVVVAAIVVTATAAVDFIIITVDVAVAVAIAAATRKYSCTHLILIAAVFLALNHATLLQWISTTELYRRMGENWRRERGKSKRKKYSKK